MTDAAIEQLALVLDVPLTRFEREEARQLELGIIRHRSDLSDHQRGQIRLDWDTAAIGQKGDLIPAWVCCVCGDPEPNPYLLQNNHSCGSLVPYCTRRDRAKAHYRFRLAEPLAARRRPWVGRRWERWHGGVERWQLVEPLASWERRRFARAALRAIEGHSAVQFVQRTLRTPLTRWQRWLLIHSLGTGR